MPNTKSEKLFAFIADWRDAKAVTVKVTDNRYLEYSAIDVISSGSMKSAIRVFNQRHQKMVWGKMRPVYKIMMP